MVDVTSSNMALLSEAQGTLFDDSRMTNEFGPDSAPTCERRDRIAGTTEVGVAKSVCGGTRESRHEKILLKTKVVLEKDVMGDGGYNESVNASPNHLHPQCGETSYIEHLMEVPIS